MGATHPSIVACVLNVLRTMHLEVQYEGRGGGGSAAGADGRRDSRADSLFKVLSYPEEPCRLSR